MNNYGNVSLDQQTHEQIEGDITQDLDVLSLGLKDDEIERAIGNRVTAAEGFWNAKLDLANVQNKAENYWLGNYHDDDELYDYQAPYQDNRIFTAIETLVSLVTSKPPQPLVTPAYDTDASYELAQNHQKALLAKYEDLYMKREFQLAARHILTGYRIAVMKLRHDDTVGKLQEDGTRYGDCSIKTLRPQRIVIDAGAQDINDIPLIAEYRSDLLTDLADRYPDKREDILKEAGFNYGVKPELTKKQGYLEVHFTTKDKEGNRIEAVAWKFKKVIMDSTKSPFWNYDDDANNFLTKPSKPYVLFNYMNLGRWVYDDTSLTEQAMILQDIHDKRGRQIVENADQANGGWVFNTLMVNADDAAAWINDPGDKIMAKGPVNEAVGRFPSPVLPDYVVQDKLDARNEIDNIFGTHGAIKGEVTNSKTLGQDVMSQRGDTARLQTLSTALEDGADRLYKLITQYMKVFYNEPQLIRYGQEEGKPSFFNFSGEQIQPGTAVRVKSGSVLPDDPLARREEVLKMFAALDPLNIAKGLNKENPKEWAKQNLLYHLAPDKYMTDVLGFTPDEVQGGSGQDPLALQHLRALSQGQQVQPEQNPTPGYLATLEAFLKSPQYKQLDPQIQQLIALFVNQSLAIAKQAMGMQGQERPGLPEGGTPPQGTVPSQQMSTPSRPPQGSTPPPAMQGSGIMGVSQQ